MAEFEQAQKIANDWLDGKMNVLTQMVPGDPDCDAVVLARQFNRTRERELTLRNALKKLRLAVKDHPDFQNREKFLDLGMEVNDAIIKSVASN